MTQKSKTLVNCLKILNRKERYWLLRQALGKKNFDLDKEFVGSLETALNGSALIKKDGGIQICKNAWWAMDYHLDWIAVALQLYSNKSNLDLSADSEKKISNCFEGNNRYCLKSNGKKTPLVRGTALDADLIVAYDNTLILIEAKGDGSWGRKQMMKKITRLNELHDFAESLGINMYLVLCSPGETKVHVPDKKKPSQKAGVPWQEWALLDGEKPIHITLEFGKKDVGLFHPKRSNKNEKTGEYSNLKFEKRPRTRR